MTEDEPAGGPRTTGVPEVDRVITDVLRIDGQPLADHVAAFEQAHDRLRRVLDETDAPSTPRAVVG